MRILPRPTWVLSVIAFLVFATILVVDGTVRGGVGVPPNKPAEKPSVQQVPFVVTHGQQVVEARTTPVQTFALKKARSPSPSTAARSRSAPPSCSACSSTSASRPRSSSTARSPSRTRTR